MADAQPARRVPRRLELCTPGEAGCRASHQRARARGPEREPVEGAQPRSADGGVIDRLGEARVARLAPLMSAGRDQERVRRIAQRPLAHPASDAAAQGGKVEGEKECGAQATAPAPRLRSPADRAPRDPSCSRSRPPGVPRPPSAGPARRRRAGDRWRRRMPPDLPGAPETRFRRRAPRREPRPRFPRPPAVRTPTPRRARYRTPRPRCVRFGARRRRTPPPDCTARGDRARSPLPESAPAHRRPFWLRASRAGRARCPPPRPRSARRARARGWRGARSEEHTSELQSLAYLVCRLLLEKKKRRWTTGRRLRLNAVSRPRAERRLRP